MCAVEGIEAMMDDVTPPVLLFCFIVMFNACKTVYFPLLISAITAIKNSSFTSCSFLFLSLKANKTYKNPH